jgi:hypothetical protein
MTPEEIAEEREKDRIYHNFVYQNTSKENIKKILKARKIKYELLSIEEKEILRKTKKEDIENKRAYDFINKEFI